MPKRLTESVAVMVIFYWLCTYILQATYTANLIAFLTGELCTRMCVWGKGIQWGQWRLWFCAADEEPSGPIVFLYMLWFVRLGKYFGTGVHPAELSTLGVSHLPGGGGMCYESGVHSGDHSSCR